MMKQLVRTALRPTELLRRTNPSFIRPLSAVPATSEDAVRAYMERHQINLSDPAAPPPMFSFRESELPEEILTKLSKDFSEPTPIQAQGLPIALSGRNLVGIAQTGSGKTLAFLLPAFIHIRNERARLQAEGDRSTGPLAIVLAPTRELAKQIEEVAIQFRKLTQIKTVCCIGGEARGRQLGMYDNGAQLMICTPGRINDFLQAGDMSLSNVGFVVMDEADRMLDMGFEPQVRSVLEHLRPERQTMMFSATWPEEVKDLAKDFLNDFTLMNIGSVELSANKNISQSVVVCPRDYKQENFLKDMEEKLSGKKVLVFTEMKSTVDRLERMLRNKRVRAMGIHGDKSQRQRSETIQRFKDGSCEVMVATDVAARGLDISGIEYVVNYDFPNDIENYIHRIGRTGRANKKGHSLTYITPDEGHVASKLIKILKEAEQDVPEDLIELSKNSAKNKYDSKVKGRHTRNREKDYARQKGRYEYGFSGLGNDDDGESGNRNNLRNNRSQSYSGGLGNDDDGGFGNRNNLRNNRSQSYSGGKGSRYNRDEDDVHGYEKDFNDNSYKSYGSRSRDSGRRRPNRDLDDDF